MYHAENCNIPSIKTNDGGMSSRVFWGRPLVFTNAKYPEIKVVIGGSTLETMGSLLAPINMPIVTPNEENVINIDSEYITRVRSIRLYI